MATKRAPLAQVFEDKEKLNRHRIHVLKQAIKASKLSHTAFAKLMDVDVRTVRRWLEGTRTIDGPTHILHVLIARDAQDIMMRLNFAW